MSDSSGITPNRYTIDGRLLHLEMSVAEVNKGIADIRVAVARLEEQGKAQQGSEARRMSDRSYWWSRLGVTAAILLPIALTVIRIIQGVTP